MISIINYLSFLELLFVMIMIINEVVFVVKIANWKFKKARMDTWHDEKICSVFLLSEMEENSISNASFILETINSKQYKFTSRSRRYTN